MSDEQHAHDEHDHALSFAGFVMTLATTAAIHFGDSPDPVTGEAGRSNLPGAQQMIDILSLLEQKTRGNLSPEERQLLDQILYELRLRWVDATGKGQASQPEEKSRIIIP